METEGDVVRCCVLCDAEHKARRNSACVFLCVSVCMYVRVCFGRVRLIIVRQRREVFKCHVDMATSHPSHRASNEWPRAQMQPFLAQQQQQQHRRQLIALRIVLSKSGNERQSEQTARTCVYRARQDGKTRNS